MSQEELKIDQDFYMEMESPNIENMETGDSDESVRGKVLFARYRYFHIPVEWAKGTPGFPLPGVFLDRYQEGQPSIREGAYFVKGARPKGGSTSFVNVIVSQATDKNGNVYQKVDQFTSFEEVWHKAQWPALKQLSTDKFFKLQSTGQAAINLARQKTTAEQINADDNTWVYGRSTLIKSDIVGKKQDGSDKATYYRGEWALFDNASEWTMARDSFFAQFTDGANGTTPTLDLTNIPAGWVKGDAVKDAASVETLYKQIRTMYDNGNGKPVLEIAKKLSLVDKTNGNPMPNKDGVVVDVAELFGHVLNMPAAMFAEDFVF